MIWTWLYRNRNVSQKIFMNHILVIVITIATLSAIVISVSTDSLETLADYNTLQMIKQVSNSLDAQIREYEDMMYYLSTDEDIIEAMAGKEGIDATMPDSYEARILSRMAAYEGRNKGIVGILIATQDDRVYANKMQRLSRDPIMRESWYEEAVNEPEALHLISNPLGRNLKGDRVATFGDDVVSLSKAIYDEKGKILGVILMDIDHKIFEDIIATSFIGKTGFVFVQDTEGQIVYTKVNDVVYHIPPQVIPDNEMTARVRVKGNDYKVSTRESMYTGWTTVGVFSLTEALAPVKRLQGIILILSLVFIIIAFILSYYLAESFTKPIGALKNLMKRAEDGELDLEYDGTDEDEIGQLGHSFNAMMLSMTSLIQLVYKEQKERREAELEIFRAQIKPHFLYNTLDTIHWLVKENKNDDAGRMIMALTRLFRITLSKGKDRIPMEEEIRHVQSYLTIQSVRYADKFDYTIDCPNQMRQLHVTKLIIQPLVENALYHGIKEKRGKGQIDIRCFIEDGDMKIQVSDNGVGICESEVKRMNDVLNHKVDRASEYGIINVHEKIRLMFGERYGLDIQSEIGKGTCVIITHPVV